MSIATLLPTNTDKPLFTQRYTLDGREWLFRFDYNDRYDGGCYFLDIGVPSTTGGIYTVRGIALMCWTDLLWRWRGRADVPRAALNCIPQGADESPPKLGELGLDRRVTLCYWEPG